MDSINKYRRYKQIMEPMMSYDEIRLHLSHHFHHHQDQMLNLNGHHHDVHDAY
jgi:hypothetical protein